MRPAINIGSNKEAIKEARLAINDILKAAHVDNQTKIEALRSLNTLCNVNNTSISGCKFTTK